MSHCKWRNEQDWKHSVLQLAAKLLITSKLTLLNNPNKPSKDTAVQSKCSMTNTRQIYLLTKTQSDEKKNKTIFKWATIL